MKYYLWILGCAMNYSDAERIASLFNNAGFIPAETEAEANVVVTVACSVRQTAIDRIYGKSKEWNKRKRKDPSFKTILSGCVLPVDRKKLSSSFDLIIDIQDIPKLEDFIQNYSIEHLNRNSKFPGRSPSRAGEIQNSRRDYLPITPKYKSSFRAYVPIMTGCDNFCSYCAVPITRGREKSRPEKDIISELKDLINKGYKEITLLGQNVNSYKYGFMELLKKIDAIPGDYRVYFYSNHPKDISDELINLLPKLKHFPHYLHLPLQSGDNDILKNMNRHYTAEQYLDLVAKIKGKIPDVVLTTDIIVGYPGEGEKEFQKTLDIVSEVGFEMIFIGQYSPRPGTASAKSEDNVPKTVKKERDRVITLALKENLEKVNKKFVGQIEKVLVDEYKKGKYYGRTEGYKVVEIANQDYPETKEGSQVKTDQSLEIGRFHDIKIIESSAWKLRGVIQY